MLSNIDRYQRIAPFYDLLDLPFERKRYASLRPLMFQNLGGRLLDAGIGTGRNCTHYPPGTDVSGIDTNPAMLERARVRCPTVAQAGHLYQMDVTDIRHRHPKFASFFPQALNPATSGIELTSDVGNLMPTSKGVVDPTIRATTSRKRCVNDDEATIDDFEASIPHTRLGLPVETRPVGPGDPRLPQPGDEPAHFAGWPDIFEQSDQTPTTRPSSFNAGTWRSFGRTQNKKVAMAAWFRRRSCAWVCAHDTLGAVGKARKRLGFVETAWAQERTPEGRFCLLSH